MARIADTFQHDRSVDRLTILSQKRGIGGAAEQVLFFQVKGDETDWSGQFHGLDLASDLEHHCEGAGIIIGAGRPLDRIEVRSEDQRRCGLEWLSVGKRRSDHIVVGAAPGLEWLRCDGKAGFRELAVQIGFRFLEANWRREGMTLAHQMAKVFFEEVVSNGHVGFRQRKG